MTNLKILLKNELLLFTNRLNNMSKKKKKNMFLLYGFIFLLVVFELIAQSYLALDTLRGTGLERFVIDQQILMLLMISVVFAITNGMILTEKDSDFLLSLPLTKIEILISKTLFKYLFDFIISFIILVPVSVLYVIITKSSFLVIVNSILLVVFLSLLFLGVEYLINTFVNGVAVKFKNFSLIKSILTIVMIFSFLGIYLYATIDGAVKMENGRTKLVASVTDFIVDNKYLYFLIVALVCVAVFSLGIFAYSTIYGKKIKGYKSKNKKLNKSKGNNLLVTLVKKEFKTYFGLTVYLMNTLVGYIMLIGASVALLFIKVNDGFLTKDLLKLIIYFFSAFCLSTCSTTNSSISLEGKRFWIFKSLPISAKTLVYSKVLMNFILVFITSTIAFLMLLISNTVGVAFSCLAYALLLSSGLIVSLVGVIINMLFPKLDYENETAVVKQSASVGISMLSFMVVFMLFPALFLILTSKGVLINLNVFALINIAFNLVVIGLSVLFINKKAEKILRKL